MNPKTKPSHINWELIAIYVIRDGIRAFANKKSPIVERLMMEGLLQNSIKNQEETRRTYTFNCDDWEGFEGTTGSFVFVWEPKHVLEAV